METVVKYSPALVIRNVDSLPRGLGSRYLLTIAGERGELVAKAWKRKRPKTLAAVEILIDFHK